MKQRKSKKIRNPYHSIVPLEAKTDNQKDYIRSIIENDVTLCSGPSGCGKSFIAAGVNTTTNALTISNQFIYTLYVVPLFNHLK